ncbi:MAG: hypothetical protein JW819_13650 [Candidatus Krumholzibacteriota bacterium]|nr:hypothetical protein [Candidatus Krumholzibacteriota bacterium]
MASTSLRSQEGAGRDRVPPASATPTPPAAGAFPASTARFTAPLPVAALRIAGLLLAVALLAATPAAAAVPWNTDAIVAFSHQGYESDSTREALLAHRVEVSVDGPVGAPLTGALRLAQRADLTLEALSAAAGLDYLGTRLGLSLDLQADRVEPGPLTAPLLSFDPDSLTGQEAGSAAYEQAGAGLRLDWTAALWDARLAADWRRLAYDEPTRDLSDARELDLATAGGLALGELLRLELDLGFLETLYDQRRESDGQELAATLRLARPLGDRWRLAVEGELAWRAVRNVDSLATYERPDGRRRRLGFQADWLGDAWRELAVSLDWEQEDWRDYPGYFVDGVSLALSLQGAWPLGGDGRLEGWLEASVYDPDSLSGEAWILRRGEERRLEGGLWWRRGEEGRWPLVLGLMAEDLSLRDDGEDRFRLLRGEIELGWRPRAALRTGARLGLDSYTSRYAGGEDGTELGLESSLELTWSPHPWECVLRLARERRHSFLADVASSDDWEAGLELRWHP